MKKHFVILFLALIASVSIAQAQSPTPFSGDLMLKGKGSENMNGKVYFSGSKLRMDMDAGGHEAIMISDLSAQTSYMLMPEQKMYMEFRLGQARGSKMPDLKSYDPNNPCASLSDMTCQKAGSETVSGRVTEKWIFKHKKSGDTTTAWIDREIHFPIRTVTGDTEMNLTNIKEGAPAASLFEVPSGYRKFDMGAMMGGKTPE